MRTIRKVLASDAGLLVLAIVVAAALASCATVHDVIDACRWDGACLACVDDDAGEIRYCPPGGE